MLDWLTAACNLSRQIKKTSASVTTAETWIFSRTLTLSALY